jgi:hypothetical protein
MKVRELKSRFYREDGGDTIRRVKLFGCSEFPGAGI